MRGTAGTAVLLRIEPGLDGGKLPELGGEARCGELVVPDRADPRRSSTTAASGGTSRRRASAGRAAGFGAGGRRRRHCEPRGGREACCVKASTCGRGCERPVYVSIRPPSRKERVRTSGLAGTGAIKNPKAWRAVDENGRTPVTRLSPTCRSIAAAASESGASDSSDGTARCRGGGRDESGTVSRPGFALATSITLRLIRAAGSVAERARSHVASVAPARA